MTISDHNRTAGKAVDIVTDQGVIDAHLFHPDEAGSWPGVLLLTDIRGVRPAFEAMGRRLAASGYVVLLPNIYYRAGRAPVVDPTLPINDEAARTRRSELRATLTPEVVRADRQRNWTILPATATFGAPRRASSAIASPAPSPFAPRRIFRSGLRQRLRSTAEASPAMPPTVRICG